MDRAKHAANLLSVRDGINAIFAQSKPVCHKPFAGEDANRP